MLTNKKIVLAAVASSALAYFWFNKWRTNRAIAAKNRFDEKFVLDFIECELKDDTFKQEAIFKKYMANDSKSTLISALLTPSEEIIPLKILKKFKFKRNEQDEITMMRLLRRCDMKAIPSTSFMQGFEHVALLGAALYYVSKLNKNFVPNSKQTSLLKVHEQLIDCILSSNSTPVILKSFAYYNKLRLTGDSNYGKLALDTFDQNIKVLLENLHELPLEKQEESLLQTYSRGNTHSTQLVNAYVRLLTVQGKVEEAFSFIQDTIALGNKSKASNENLLFLLTENLIKSKDFTRGISVLKSHCEKGKWSTCTHEYFLLKFLMFDFSNNDEFIEEISQYKNDSSEVLIDTLIGISQKIEILLEKAPKFAAAIQLEIPPFDDQLWVEHKDELLNVNFETICEFDLATTMGAAVILRDMGKDRSKLNGKEAMLLQVAAQRSVPFAPALQNPKLTAALSNFYSCLRICTYLKSADELNDFAARAPFQSPHIVAKYAEKVGGVPGDYSHPGEKKQGSGKPDGCNVM